MCHHKSRMFVYIPDLSDNVTVVLNDIRNQVRAMSNNNFPLWTSVWSWVKGDLWKNVMLIIVIPLLLLFLGPCNFNCATQLDASHLGFMFQVHPSRFSICQ